jgi:hypothetical protein
MPFRISEELIIADSLARCSNVSECLHGALFLVPSSLSLSTLQVLSWWLPPLYMIHIASINRRNPVFVNVRWHFHYPIRPHPGVDAKRHLTNRNPILPTTHGNPENDLPSGNDASQWRGTLRGHNRSPAIWLPKWRSAYSLPAVAEKCLETGQLER